MTRSTAPRPLRRAIQTQVEDAVAEKLLDGALHPGDTVQARLEEGRVVICPIPPAA